MHFLAQGDYNFPFTWQLYWAKHAYMWSFQSGTPNPDGFIRLPARVLNFLVFMLFGNMAVSYFYVISSLLIAFATFYIFCRTFLHVKSRIVCMLCASFFAFNPIFLGNLAKVGLIIAVAMLPLCFALIQKAFATKRLRYLVLYVICLNISLMHPYTFAVNLAASGIYLAWMAWQHRQFVFHNTLKIIGLVLLAIALNAYFLLPVISLGSVSKDIISDNVRPTQTDYTSLVTYSNTGDVLRGLSLAKNVFLDFSFYNYAYQSLYLLGVFGFYALLLAAFLSTERSSDVHEKRRMAVLLGAFLLLILLATTLVFNVDVLIKFLISLPGGWAFRSPLKWQLYIPLALFAILALTLNTHDQDKRLGIIIAGFVCSFLLMNGYLFYDVYLQLLVPRTLTHFASLMHINLNDKTMLFVNSPDCMAFSQANPRLVTELNQVFVSNNLQVKRVLVDDLPSVNIASYDYVLSCVDDLHATLEQTYRFAATAHFANNSYVLYANKSPAPAMFAVSNVLNVDPGTDVGQIYHFAASTYGAPPTFLPAGTTLDGTTTDISDVFGGISVRSLQPSAITTTISAQSGTHELYAENPTSPLYYQLSSSSLRIASTAAAGFTPLPFGNHITTQLAAAHPLKITYASPGFTYKNLISNPSFEQGLWQKRVGDCYDFDNDPGIAMRVDHAAKTNGYASLELSAARHIACLSSNTIAVVQGEHYLLNFDYRSSEGDTAGVHSAFDDSATTVFAQRLVGKINGWQTYSQELIAPPGAHHLTVELYGYPGKSETTAATHYDNVSLTEIPPLQHLLYLVKPAASAIQVPDSIEYQTINPTERLVHIAGAKQPFYLASTDSYNPMWQLAFARSARAQAWSLSKAQLPTTEHVQLNGTMNGWYIDPQKLCASGTCTHNANGTYTMDLVVQFVPQHWFYVGATISAAAWLGTAGYFVRNFWRDRSRLVRYRQWR